MNCDCIKKTEERMLIVFNEQKRFSKKIVAVKIERALIFGKELESMTYCNVEIELEGQKKKVHQSLMHNYCPFCGDKIVKDFQQNKTAVG